MLDQNFKCIHRNLKYYTVIFMNQLKSFSELNTALRGINSKILLI